MDADPGPAGLSRRERFGRAFHRMLHPTPVILDTRRPVEVPVLTETKRLWTRGEHAASIHYAYHAVLSDLQRGYSVEFPPDWTHQDILERGVTPAMGPIPDFLVELLALYEPIRYSNDAPGELASPVPLVESIYSQPMMWELYLAQVPYVAPVPAPTGSTGGTAEPNAAGPSA